MADIAVATIAAEDRPTFINLMCDENHYEGREDKDETREAFADRTYQDALDKKIIDVAGVAWTHGLNMAMALAEEGYVNDNPPPAGFHVDPPNARILAEAKAQ